MTDVERAIVDFPELQHYLDRPDVLVAIAEQLRTFKPDELRMRRTNLAKNIKAEKEGRIQRSTRPIKVRIGRAR
jgi:hypothetical protein